LALSEDLGAMPGHAHLPLSPEETPWEKSLLFASEELLQQKTEEQAQPSLLNFLARALYSWPFQEKKKRVPFEIEKTVCLLYEKRLFPETNQAGVAPTGKEDQIFLPGYKETRGFQYLYSQLSARISDVALGALCEETVPMSESRCRTLWFQEHP
jgi:hypothetical protein